MSPSSDPVQPPMEPVSPLEQALHAARALVLADLAAGKVAEADVVSMVEDSVVQRRWWVEQWPDGVAYVGGLVAQDVQDALLERYGRWPLCPVCGDGDPHALDVEPELGPDPRWVCHKAGVRVAAVGALGSAYGAAYGEASGDVSGEASGEAPSS
ncbi:hypothetical protein PV733_32325 [Streptomyces europaeiscabiei]|uniref:Uncharacterized protein n=2 Tax=Streptomyces europaeiscabiei TaxID=146819 RepID=A0ABU4NG11_9ACTN|nr:hypothetical protein [Streptomyces europaeiscabiei]MDX2530135.1 hypothetical protein [Streptomyces europaeiscabiei]MDX3544610.1 hypothetical protein [Streptomyces europaeiscabiei]MDX3553960.1 hypothetical protein [Streptomyces europaeiscabiei]MDX3702078.1 hypothetical protein [Streptomyces europaeiscabiei]MDX3713553.1 hypothetical protein [Streptomyces europaeiscabiei]